MDATTGAESASGPAFDALRAAFIEFAQGFPRASGWSWRLAGQDDSGAIFLARTEALGPPGWVSVEVATDAGGWRPTSMGQCAPFVILSPEFGPASWALDPASDPPTAATTELHILVWERACSGGAPATGRISAPVVVYAATTVTITVGVRPRVVPAGAALTCEMPPGTPAVLQLSEPLGQRTLLDGGEAPPVPPSPANG